MKHHFQSLSQPFLGFLITRLGKFPSQVCVFMSCAVNIDCFCASDHKYSQTEVCIPPAAIQNKDRVVFDQ